MRALAGYIAALVAFVAADMVWLGIMVDRVYRPALAGVLAASVNLGAAMVFYLLFPIGLSIFAIAPALKAESAWVAAGYGGLFGFFSYATYDLTNHSTIRDWALQVTIVDIAWGFVLSAFAAVAGYYVASRLPG